MQNWIVLALLGAAAAALTNIFAKVGMKDIDSTMATAIRSSIGTIYLLSLATILGKWPHLKSLNPKALVMIILAGIAGASSWLLEFRALAIGGPVAGVVALDKLSVPLAVVLAVVLLQEKLLPVNWVGVAMIVAGGYLVAYKG